MEERRRHQRTELNSHIIIKAMGTENTESHEAVIEISDVSKTGIGFISTERLEINSTYEAYLRIWTSDVLHAFLRIIRIENAEDSENVYHYGATFVGMPELDASKISIYQQFYDSDQK
ncbi:MAG: PilZ domain-containing protein [Lachnospiraceae bacterium]|nr:PilZ domain-containing protein [Lachnospiraceae bacterium]